MLESICAGGDTVHRLIWSEADGVGFLDGDSSGIYDEAYFAYYANLADTDMARRLNEFRSLLVLRHRKDSDHVLDVGIGDGAFLRELEDCKALLEIDGLRITGCDVNPMAIAYLIERAQLWSMEDGADVVTFWDSLEHIRDPRPALQSARRVAIVSIPVFYDAAHALSSRHYKPGEHFWYWTRRGFIAFANRMGFDCVDVLATETALGRDGIETFILKRRPA